MTTNNESELALYFGYGDGGHFLRCDTPETQTLRPKQSFPGFPWEIQHLDGGLLCNRQVLDRPDGRVHWTCAGRPVLWHAFFWWDRSGDKRPGSCSGFYVRGFDIGQREEAFEYACSQWPDVIERQKFVFQLVEPPAPDLGGGHE